MKEFSHPTFPTIHIQLLNKQDHTEMIQQFVSENHAHLTNNAVALTAAEVLNELLDFVPSQNSARDKNLYGIFDNQKLIGLIDWITNTPTEGTALIREFTLEPSYFEAGLALPLYHALEQMAHETDAEKITVALEASKANMIAFWQEQGFEKEAEQANTISLTKNI